MEPFRSIAAWQSDRRGRRPMTLRWSLISTVILVVSGAYRGSVVIIVQRSGLGSLASPAVSRALFYQWDEWGRAGADQDSRSGPGPHDGELKACATLTGFVFPAFFARLGEPVAIYALAGGADHCCDQPTHARTGRDEEVDRTFVCT
ncbi:hypothetical protein [Ferrimicrobium sp.]|uniref:hypothetical protein n=1 Tax=Ferrimicrobium sp. TaxID=2926050 RepID=UPI00260CF93F|nr:hypothetical protein [Ferrimicrobium sp.]